MKFVSLTKGEVIDRTARGVVFLVYNDWDDWFEFETKHIAMYVDAKGVVHRLGAVKIGQKGQSARRVELPRSFTALDEEFFSIGQDEDYYALLTKLEIEKEVLTGLRDMAFDANIYETYKDERVADISLFRSVTEDRVTNRFRRLSHRDVALSNYSFTYKFPERISGIDTDVEIDFEVTPYSNPPTNIHVLIGRNGVGKTTCMSNMIRSILGIVDEDPGEFSVESHLGSADISNVISVTFSAFDPFFPPEKKYKDDYDYVGLKRRLSKAETALYASSDETDAPEYLLKNLDDLQKEFVKTARRCRKGVKLERWSSALTALSSDPLFAESEVLYLADDEIDDEEWEEDANSIFKGLSSGHKVVLLTISRLVELVQEQSLVLLDEPEGHLHPPLLSAFVRALSSLLIKQNGVAIIATHSPVVLQEVPKSCVWILDRAGRTIDARRPVLETFGEGVGQLTHEVFGLEVTETGFYKMIRDAVERGMSVSDVEAAFGQQIGGEGLAVASALAHEEG